MKSIINNVLPRKAQEWWRFSMDLVQNWLRNLEEEFRKRERDSSLSSMFMRGKGIVVVGDEFALLIICISNLKD